MQLDITRTPFSKYGSYLSLGYEPAARQLLIRNVREKWGQERLISVGFARKGAAVEFTVTATPTVVSVISPVGRARLVLRGDTGVVVASEGLDVRLTLLENQHGFGFQETDRRFKLLSVFGKVFTAVDVLCGDAIPAFSREVEHGHQVSKTTEVSIACEGGKALALIEVTTVETSPGPVQVDVDVEMAVVQREWDAFLMKLPPVPEERRASAELLWYNIWSCFVRAGGNLAYDAVLMSKGSMASIWSWDHCFNALALAKVDMKAALEQFLLPFELQQPNGVLPDFWNATDSLYTVVKPPIHGWCIRKMLDGQEIDQRMLRDIYDHLVKWTEWWFTLRDTDGDGIPNYLQGVDSGWDNATLFDLGIGLESPELSAFLVLQMHALRELALRLGDAATAANWQQQADDLLQRLIAHSWDGKQFLAKISRTHEYDPQPTCLLTVMPLVLVEYLPAEIFATLVERLERDFLTNNGPATEMPTSAKYDSNGYWRGPIWAPTTYLLVDGLARGGRRDLAERIARNFCDMVTRAGGNYENYDALTGQGLCDQGYTWTASVNLLLMNEYLLIEKI